jgi:superfamily II DNA or RNA helicase
VSRPVKIRSDDSAPTPELARAVGKSSLRDAALPFGPAPQAAIGPDLDDAESEPEFVSANPEAVLWDARLRAALAESGRSFLPLAEEAIAACPGDPDLLLLAANAALLDGNHERALVFLKRFAKRAESPSETLLRALALHLARRRSPARQLLERHRLTELYEVLPFYPAGAAQLRWLARQLDEILERAPHARWFRDAREARIASRARATSEKPRRATTVAKRERDTPRRESASPAEPASAAPTPLPLVDIDVKLRIDLDLAPLTAALAQPPACDGRDFALRERLAHLGLVQGFDELLCLPHLVGVEPLWHQIETVRKVLKQFRGRVLLADEVGLGKTIEAGMAVKEYALRGMAERVLVLTPASLVGQWREELERKFGLDFATTYDALLREDPARFWDQKRIVASIATARRREHVEALAARPLDVVVVDEAHHLRDRHSAGWKLVDALNKRFLLLLTATPVQNDLVELYNLLTLLKPGIFKTLNEFRAAYMTPGKPRQPANPDRLRELMRGAMVRNTRAVVALKLPRRHAATIRVEPAHDEAEAYAAFAEAARGLARAGGGKQRLLLHHLLGAAGSSPAAAARAAGRIAEKGDDDGTWRGLAARFAAIACGGKETSLLEMLQRNPGEKKIVFVQARETLEHLGTRLAASGIVFERFDGSMSGPAKDAAIAAFRDRAAVLLCTQSGGEGRNIQFCNTLINFDVPWNPMAIEQRIGRIDRIGQEREVFVFNLVTRGTIEEQVLGLLEEKIAMFELVVGEVGAILGNVEDEREFPDLVLDAWLVASETGRAAAFTALGERLDAARRQHAGAKALDEQLFGQDFETA